MSDDGAVTDDGLADDQILHLISAFVGVQRFFGGQPTMYRVIRSPRAVSRNELPPCRRFASGTRTSFRVIWPFWTTLSAILCSIFSTLKPGVDLFSTMNPFT